MKTMTKMTKAGKMGVVAVAVAGMAGLAGADLIYTDHFPNGSFEGSPVLTANTSQAGAPSGWAFSPAAVTPTSTAWVGNLNYAGNAVTPHDGDQIAYLQPTRYGTDRYQNSPDVTLTSAMFNTGETSGTLQVSAWYQRRGGPGTRGSYIHVYLNGAKLGGTVGGATSQIVDTDWQEHLWDQPELSVSVGDTLGVILWGYSYAAGNGLVQILWDDVTFTVTSVPEPGSLALLGAGSALILTVGRRARVRG